MANILIVGDDHTLSHHQREVLRRQGCHIVGVFPSIPGAIAQLQSPNLDLMLVDLSPHLDSPLERIAWVRNLPPDQRLPLIFITPPLDESTLHQAIAVAPAGVLLKPIRTAELQATVQLALASVQRERSQQVVAASASTLAPTRPRLPHDDQPLFPPEPMSPPADYSGAAIGVSQAGRYQHMQRLNAILEKQIQQRTAQLRQAFQFEAILKRITDRVRDSLDEKHILQTAVRELALAIGVRICNAALYDTEHQTSTICHEFNATNTLFQSYTLPMSSFPEGYQHLLAGEYFQFCDRLAHDDGRTAKLSCPIVDDQGVLGDLWLIHDADYGFVDSDIRLVELVASQCAIALRQARLFQATQVQIQQLERLHRLKDDFLSTISHELRTPMTNIKMAITMLGLMEPFAEAIATGTGHRYFTILQRECQREIELIDNLLDLSELTANPVPFMPAPVDVDDCVTRQVAAYYERAIQGQRTLDYHIAGPIPPLLTDGHSLARILNELLNNACKYTPPQEQIRVSVRLVSGGRRAAHPPLPWPVPSLDIRANPPLGDAVVEINVTNTGVEIPQAEQSRIFEKFYRIPQADPWKYSGTGLGLAIVKKLVAHIQATLEVRSEAQQTSFILRIPHSHVHSTPSSQRPV